MRHVYEFLSMTKQWHFLARFPKGVLCETRRNLPRQDENSPKSLDKVVETGRNKLKSLGYASETRPKGKKSLD